MTDRGGDRPGFYDKHPMQAGRHSWVVRAYLLFLCTIPFGEISLGDGVLGWLTPTKLGFVVLVAAVATALARGWRPRMEPVMLVLVTVFALGAAMAAALSPAPRTALVYAARLVGLAGLCVITGWARECGTRNAGAKRRFRPCGEQCRSEAETPPLRGRTGLSLALFGIGCGLAVLGIWQTAAGRTIGELGVYDDFGRMIALYLPGDGRGVSVVRASATFDHPNVFGTFLLGATPLGILLMSRTSRRHGRVLVATGVVLCVAALVFTFARSAWIGLFIAMGVLATRPALRVPALTLPVLGAALAVGLLPPEARPVFLDRGTTVQTYDVGRLISFRAAGRMIAERPLRGVGPGRFDAAFDTYSRERHAIRQNRLHSMDAHNTLLDLGAEAGVVTMLAFAALVLTALVRLWRRRDEPLALALLAGLAAVAFQGLLNSLQYEEIVWVAMGMGLATGREEDADRLPE